MEDYHKPDQQTLQALKDTANRLRISSIKATTAAGSGRGAPAGKGRPARPGPARGRQPPR
uniref:Uncharacterized protein n=1 Tax=Otus sunia TaxID=257818 RepID=A0A8C8AMU7_9STRI